MRENHAQSAAALAICNFLAYYVYGKELSNGIQVTSNAFACHNFGISGNPKVHAIISQWCNTFQKCNPPDFAGWLGWAIVLDSFQFRGVLLLLHIVGQGPAVLAAGAGRVGYIFLYFTSSFPF